MVNLDRYVGKQVVVRTINSGVHIGTLAEIDTGNQSGKAVLEQARRLWFWKGANTLTEVANNGVAAGSRLSKPSASPLLLLDVIEVHLVTDAAAVVFSSTGWGE